MFPFHDEIGKLISYCYTKEGYDESRASKLASIRDTLHRRRVALDMFRDSILHELSEAEKPLQDFESKKEILPGREAHRAMDRLELLTSIYLEAYLFFVVSFLDALSDVLPLFYPQAKGSDFRAKKSSIMKHNHTRNSLLSKFFVSDTKWEVLMKYRGDIYHHPADACKIGRQLIFGMDGEFRDGFLVLLPVKMQKNLFPAYDSIEGGMPVRTFIEQIQQTLDSSSTMLLSTILGEKTKGD